MWALHEIARTKGENVVTSATESDKESSLFANGVIMCDHLSIWETIKFLKIEKFTKA